MRLLIVVALFVSVVGAQQAQRQESRIILQMVLDVGKAPMGVHFLVSNDQDKNLLKTKEEIKRQAREAGIVGLVGNKRKLFFVTSKTIDRPIKVEAVYWRICNGGIECVNRAQILMNEKNDSDIAILVKKMKDLLMTSQLTPTSH